MSIEHESSEDSVIRRLDSGILAKHLYERHSIDFFAYLNLSLSTLTILVLGRAVKTPSQLNWFLGWTASEIGQVFLLLQCLNLYRVFKYNPIIFNRWFGRLAILVNVYYAGTICSNIYKSFGTRTDFSKALLEQKIQPRSSAGTSRSSKLLSLIPLFLVSRRGKHVGYHKDIRYADMEKVDPNLLQMWKQMPPKMRAFTRVLGRGRIGNWLNMDVIAMKALQNAPVYVHIHGGSWLLGCKDLGPHALAERIASRGVVVCMINYRLSPEAAFPAHIQDCKRALIYIKRHIASYGGDPRKVFVGGDSAGGHLSALVGATPNLPMFQPAEDMGADTSVAGSIPIYGVFDFCDELGHHTALGGPIFDVHFVLLRTVTSRLLLQTPFTSENKRLFEFASPTYHIKECLNALVKPNIGPFLIPRKFIGCVLRC